MAANTHIKETVDLTTGEVLRRENSYTVKAKTQPFISIPLPVSALLHQLTSMKDMRVLLALANLSEFNTNAVYLIAHRRQEVMSEAGVSSSQLSTALKRLRVLGLITGRKGEAVINPVVMWKGNSATRKEMIAAIATKPPPTYQ